jgi:hypothetical protein
MVLKSGAGLHLAGDFNAPSAEVGTKDDGIPNKVIGIARLTERLDFLAELNHCG